jgi:general secretion pathway protein M
LSQSAFKPIINAYENLSSKDRFAVRVLSFVLLIFLIYVAIWKPAKAFRESAQSDMDYYQHLVEWIKTNQSQIRLSATNTGQSNSQIQNSQQLVSAVSNMAKQYKLSLKRLEPSGDHKIRIWLEKSSFNDTILWLQNLNKNYGIHVSQIAIERNDTPGLVDITLTLNS